MSKETVYVVAANGLRARDMFPTVNLEDTFSSEQAARSMIPYWRRGSQHISALPMMWSVIDKVIEHDDTPKWVITKSHPSPYHTPLDYEYWSNETGWGSLAGADRFTDRDTKDLNLPMDGAWCMESLAKYWEGRRAR